MTPEQLAALREKRGSAYDAMQSVLDSVGDDGMTSEQNQEYTRAETDFDSADAAIRAHERAAERNRSGSMLDDTGDPERRAARADETRSERFERALATAAQSEANVRSFVRTDEYREAFVEGALRGYLGGANIAPEHRAALELVAEHRAALALGADATGGYIAPEEFVKELFIEAAEESTVRQFARIISTSHGRDLSFPQFGSKPVAQWTNAEVVTNPDSFESEPSFAAPKVLHAHPAQAESVTSKDLLQDAVFDVEALIRELLVEAFSVLTAEAYWTGNGTGQPTGLINGIASANTVVGAASATPLVSTDDLIDVQHKIKRRYRNSARWFFNDATLKAVRVLEYSDGRKIWQPSLTSGEPATILGKPYEVDEYVPDMAVDGIGIVYGDLKGYAIRDVLALAIQRLTDSNYTRKRQVGFLGDIRTDGLMLRPETVAAFKNGPAA